jgi:mannose-6-phosphate isomerase-like protein (cupin superfamily)
LNSGDHERTECAASRLPARDPQSVDEEVQEDAVLRVVPTVQYLPVEFDGRRVGHLTVDTPGERDEWEMHPHQDELLYLLEGVVDVFLRAELDSEDQQPRRFQQGEACVVPKGIWHRQVVVAPCRMLFLTPETLHRSYSPGRGWSDSTGV